MAQEKLIQASSIPYTIIRATQFCEFVKSIADFSTQDNQVRLPSVLFQPMAADDVARALARVAMGPPANGFVEIGGPDQGRLDEMARRELAALKDPRQVIADPQAYYYAIAVSEKTLIPGKGAQLGQTHFEEWLGQEAKQPSTPRKDVAAA